MKGRIVSIHKSDAFFSDQDSLIGRSGEFTHDLIKSEVPGYVRGDFTTDPDSKGRSRRMYFRAVEIASVEEPCSPSSPDA